MRTHAVELVRTGPDLILVHGNRALAAVQRETHDIRIVFAAVADAVDFKQVESLARPGGNATGFTIFAGPMLGKLTKILKEIAPDVTHVALVFSRDTPGSVRDTLALEAAAEVLGVKVVLAPVRNPGEIGQAIEMFAREPNGGTRRDTRPDYDYLSQADHCARVPLSPTADLWATPIRH
jgi:putative tryptophan/tyrosine transport system substrate-binding protein